MLIFLQSTFSPSPDTQAAFDILVDNDPEDIVKKAGGPILDKVIGSKVVKKAKASSRTAKKRRSERQASVRKNTRQLKIFLTPMMA